MGLGFDISSPACQALLCLLYDLGLFLSLLQSCTQSLLCILSITYFSFRSLPTAWRAVWPSYCWGTFVVLCQVKELRILAGERWDWQNDRMYWTDWQATHAGPCTVWWNEKKALCWNSTHRWLQGLKSSCSFMPSSTGLHSPRNDGNWNSFILCLSSYVTDGAVFIHHHLFPVWILPNGNNPCSTWFLLFCYVVFYLPKLLQLTLQFSFDLKVNSMSQNET